MRAEEIKGILKKQALIVLVLWALHVSSLVLEAKSESFSELLKSHGVMLYDSFVPGYDSFSFYLVTVLSAVALALNLVMGVRFSSRAWINRVMFVAVPVAIANAAFWTMTVPAFAVLAPWGLVSK